MDDQATVPDDGTPEPRPVTSADSRIDEMSLLDATRVVAVVLSMIRR